MGSWLNVVLEVLFIASFSLFATNIARGYVSTFFTTVTAKQFCCQLFHDATSDYGRFHLLTYHPSFFQGVREELKNWIADNWAKWNDEKPDWFTAQIVSCVPKDMIPKEEEDWDEREDERTRRRRRVRRKRRRKSRGLIRRNNKAAVVDLFLNRRSFDFGQRTCFK